MSVKNRLIIFIGFLLIVVIVWMFFVVKPAWIPWVNNEAKEPGNTTVQSNSTSTVATAETYYPVDAVLAGDSLAVRIENEIEVVQIIGIHTPYPGGIDEPMECQAVQASEKADELLSGKKVALRGDGTQAERDKFDRLLKYVILRGGRDYGKFMIEQGLAYERTVNPGVDYQARTDYLGAQAQAKSAKRGVWGDNPCANQ